jgi:uncharacterized repeat protein (TIGR01451 family)
MFQFARRFISKVLIGAMIAFTLMPSLASANGTLNVNTNLTNGSYTIYNVLNVNMGTGSGMQATTFSLPSGGYRISFNPVTGYSAPADIFINLLNGSSQNQTGTYTVSSNNNATLSIGTNLSAGAYTIYDINSSVVGSGGGLSYTGFSLASGGYRVSFASVTGYNTPRDIYINLLSNDSRVISGSYVAIGGNSASLTLSTNLSNGAYEIRNVSNQLVASGSGMTPVSYVLTPGAYSVVFLAVSGYNAPATQYLNLQNGDALTYVGNYSVTTSTGTLFIEIEDVSGNPIAGDWTIYSGNDATAPVYSSGTNSSTLLNAPNGAYFITANLVTPYTSNVVTSLNPQFLNAGGNATFTVVYGASASNIATLEITTTPITAAISVDGNLVGTPATPGTFVSYQIDRTLAHTISFAAVAGYNTPANVTIPANTLAANSTTQYTGNYTLIPGTGTVMIDLQDSAGANVTNENWTLYSGIDNTGTIVQSGTGDITIPGLAVGNYFVEATTNNGGYQSVSVTSANPQVVINGGTSTFTIAYTLQPNTGTVVVDLQDSAAANVTNETWTLYAGIDNTGAVIQNGTGDAVIPNLAIGNYFLETTSNIGGFQSVAVTSANPQNLTNGSAITFNVLYTLIPNTGTVVVDLQDSAGANVPGETWTLYSGVDNTGTVVQSGTGDMNLPNLATGNYFLETTSNAGGYQSVSITSVNPQNLTTGATITFNVLYTLQPNTGTVVVDLQDSTNADVPGETWTLYSGIDNTGTVVQNGTGDATLPNLAIGNYFLETTSNISGYQSVAITSVNPQNLTNASVITFNVLYTLVPNTGTVVVDLQDSAGANVPGETWTLYAGIDNTGTVVQSGTGDMNLPNLAIGNYFLETTSNAGGYQSVAITSVNPQNLTTGATITFNVLYTLVPNSGTVVIDLQDSLGANVTVETWTLYAGVDNTGAVVQNGTGDATLPNLAIGNYFLETTSNTGAYQSVAITSANPQNLTNASVITFNVLYTIAGATGTVVIDLQDSATANVPNETWTLYSGIDNTGTIVQNGTGDANIPNLAIGNYFLETTSNIGGYQSVAITSLNPQNLTTGATITFNVLYTLQPNTGTVVIDLQDSANVNVANETWTLYSGIDNTGAVVQNGTGDAVIPNLATGSYFLETTSNIGGFQSVAITSANPQVLAASTTATFNVLYTLVPNSGTVIVDLQDSAAANVPNETWTLYAGVDNTGAVVQNGTGDATLPNLASGNYFLETTSNIGGFQSVAITSANPQNLTTGGTITFNVLYTLQPNTGTVAVDLQDSLGANVTVETWTLYSGIDNTGAVVQNGTGDAVIPNLAIGNYFLETTSNTGAYQSVAITSANPQNLTNASVITFNVLYTIAAPQPDLTVSAITLTAGTPVVGTTVTFTVDYANLSAITGSTGATLDIDYDETRGALVLPLPAGCVDNTPVAGTLRCTLPAIAASATGSLVFDYAINAGTANQISPLSATITSLNGDSNAANNTLAINTTIQGDLTITKTASAAVANNNDVITYTVTVVNNTTASLNVSLTDTIDNNANDLLDNIPGASGGQLLIIDGNGACSVVGGGGCAGNDQLNRGAVTFTLTAQNATATITYQTRANNAGIATSGTSVATNTATASYTLSGPRTVTDNELVTLNGPVPTPPGGGGGSGGGSSGSGGGYKSITGTLELDISKKVSLDGSTYLDASSTSRAIEIPEHQESKLYYKVSIQNKGKVSARNVKMKYAYNEKGAGIDFVRVSDVSGADFDAKTSTFKVDKVKAGKVYEFMYAVTVSDWNSSPAYAEDALELISFGTMLPTQQDAITRVGVGDLANVYLYAGPTLRVDPLTPAEETDGETSNISTITIPGLFTLTVEASKNSAMPGETVLVKISGKNLSDEDMTNLDLASGFENGTLSHFIKNILRPGEAFEFSYEVTVSEFAELGSTLRLITLTMADQLENFPVVENFIQVGNVAGLTPGRPFELAQTGALDMAGLLLIVALAGLGYRSLEKKRFASMKSKALMPL